MTKKLFALKHQGIDRLFEESNAQHIEIQKLQFIEELVRLLFIVCVLICLFVIFNKIGNFLSQIAILSNFSDHTDYLYSIFILPLIYYLTDITRAFDSLFVTALIKDNSLTVKRGLFFTKYDKLYLKDVNNIEYYRTPGGKLFGYGQLDLYAIGGVLSLPFVKDNKHNFIIIKNIIKQVKKNQS